VDQRRQGRDQVDTTVMPDVRCQRGAPAVSCARLQSRQFPAHAGDTGANQGLVTDKFEGQADQGRREGREPWPLHRLPDGRGRNPSTNVPGDFAADCRTATEASARAGVRQPMIMRSRTPDGGSTPGCEAKPDTSAPTTPGRARIASDRPPTRTALPGSQENRYDAPQIRCSSGESQMKLARWWLT